jgi:hypothetical protein
MGAKITSDLKLLPLFLILLGVFLRLLPHPANVAPITALALFGAVFLPKRFAFIIPLAAVFLSDLFIGFYGMTMFFVYGSFILSGLIGLYIRTRKSVRMVIGGSLLSSLLFFLITNFGVWINPISFYSKNIEGLLLCYTAALPFFRNTLLGDLFFSGLFFGGYKLLHILIKRYLPTQKWLVS